MRAIDKHWRLAFAFALIASTQCTLLNPLDHLQSGRDADDASLPDADAPADEASTVADGGPAPPGCAPERWSECGVLVVGTPKRPGSIAVGNGTDVFYSDEDSGDIFRTKCSASQCDPATRIVSGEDGPHSLSFTSDSLFWTTKTAVKRLRILVPPDAGPQAPEKVDDVTGVADIVASYPAVFWADDRGVRATGLGAPDVHTLWSSPASHPTAKDSNVAFVAGGNVHTCAYDYLSTKQCNGGVGTLPGLESVVLVERAELFAFGFFQLSVPFLVSRARADGGSELLVSDHDDAGAPLSIAEEATSMPAIGRNATHVYWTTVTGELRRRRKDDTHVQTVLRGLGPDTQMATSNDQVFIADRAMGRVLIVSPQ